MAQADSGTTTSTMDRPIHRACVVPGCPCRSDAPGTGQAGARRGRSTTIRPAFVVSGPRSAGHVDIAWKTVGLPIV
jgi:hypothetical protein